MNTTILYKPYRDENYAAFSAKLSKDPVFPHYGVRIPVLRKLACNIEDLSFPVVWHEDVLLKSLAIGKRKIPFGEKTVLLDELIPYFTSWDHSDTAASALKVNSDDKYEAFSYFSSLLKDTRVFVRRLGIVWLMSNRKLFDCDTILSNITEADNSDYYTSMAVAWALSMFFCDGYERTEYWMKKVSYETAERARRKIRESRRKGV